MAQHSPGIHGGGFGRYLRSVREARRLSLDAVEEMTLAYPDRVTKSHLSRIENGQADPTFPKMYALSQVYGLPIASLAEQFEVDLRRRALPDELARRDDAALIEEARALHLEGRHTEALMRFELLLERARGGSNGARSEAGPAADVVQLRLWRVVCLVSLDRYAVAKEECENLLALPGLSVEKRVLTLHYFARCCYRLEKYTIAMMAIERAEGDLDQLDDPRPMRAQLCNLRGELSSILGHPRAARDAFRSALAGFEELGDGFQACRLHMNLGVALEECGEFEPSRRELEAALAQAREAGWVRQAAFALHAMGKLRFRQDDLDGAESRLMESNRLARERDLVVLVFCNGYYLWKIATARGDRPRALAQLRSLRAYAGRVPDSVAEAREFRLAEKGGAA